LGNSYSIHLIWGSYLGKIVNWDIQLIFPRRTGTKIIVCERLGSAVLRGLDWNTKFLNKAKWSSIHLLKGIKLIKNKIYTKGPRNFASNLLIPYF
jgi:hypothetical protein